MNLLARLNHAKNSFLHFFHRFFHRLQTDRKFALISLIIFLVLVLAVCGITYAATENSSNTSEDKSNEEVSPTPTSEPSPTASLPTQKVTIPLSPTATPTPSTGTIEMRYLDENTKAVLSDKEVKLTIRGKSEKDVTGMGTATATGLIPGTYDALGALPSGYTLVTNDCSSSCQGISSEMVCDARFELKAGETVTITCTFKTYGQSAPAQSNEKPVIEITYPKEGETVTFTSPDQTLCIVTKPISGLDGSGNIYYSFNGGQTSTTGCIKPPVGANSVVVYYKKSNGVEGDKMTRNYIFVKNY